MTWILQTLNQSLLKSPRLTLGDFLNPYLLTLNYLAVAVLIHEMQIPDVHTS